MGTRFATAQLKLQAIGLYYGCLLFGAKKLIFVLVNENNTNCCCWKHS